MKSLVLNILIKKTYSINKVNKDDTEGILKEIRDKSWGKVERIIHNENDTTAIKIQCGKQKKKKNWNRKTIKI